MAKAIPPMATAKTGAMCLTMKSEVASPQAVVRLLASQNPAVTSGTFERWSWPSQVRTRVVIVAVLVIGAPLFDVARHGEGYRAPRLRILSLLGSSQAPVTTTAGSLMPCWSAQAAR